MSRRRKRNPQQFTTDEAQTATLIYTEGWFRCHTTKDKKRYRYPAVRIGMCVKEALEPASRVFRRKIMPATRKEQIFCPPELFPPDGRGRWEIETTGKPAERIMERLSPLIPEYYRKKWEEHKRKCR